MTIKKRYVNERIMELEFKAGKKKKYKIEVIWDSVVYMRELEISYLSKIYYFSFRKTYLENKFTLELILAI